MEIKHKDLLLNKWRVLNKSNNFVFNNRKYGTINVVNIYKNYYIIWKRKYKIFLFNIFLTIT